MRFWRYLNPFSWSQRAIIGVFSGFFAICIPLWCSGLSAFASTVNPVSGSLRIPMIGLNTPVTAVEAENGELATPERLVGAHRGSGAIFLYGHSTGVFRKLSTLKIGAGITYTDEAAELSYTISAITVAPRDETNMAQLLSGNQGQLILMTCTGERLADGDYAERLIIHATANPQ